MSSEDFKHDLFTRFARVGLDTLRDIAERHTAEVEQLGRHLSFFES